MNIYGWIHLLAGWLVGLLLLLGQVTFYGDGRVDGWTRLAGAAILAHWLWMVRRRFVGSG